MPAAIPERQIWRGSRVQLHDALRERARKAVGRWIWYALPSGVVVAMRATLEPHGCELRIARETAPPPGETFDHEVALLLRHFGPPFAWRPIENAGAGELVRLYTAVPPAARRCARCSGEVSDAGVYREDLCTNCAIAAGREESAGHQERR